jgi:hypothetical protein
MMRRWTADARWDSVGRTVATAESKELREARLPGFPPLVDRVGLTYSTFRMRGWQQSSGPAVVTNVIGLSRASVFYLDEEGLTPV